jgi:hypothetical protein
MRAICVLTIQPAIAIVFKPYRILRRHADVYSKDTGIDQATLCFYAHSYTLSSTFPALMRKKNEVSRIGVMSG